LLLLLLTFLSLCCAAALSISRSRDTAVFRDVIAREIEAPVGTGQFVAELTAWVYAKEGFAKNHSHFLWPALGATPMQIFQEGGDCADKSRLLSAMLGAAGIESSLVMLQPCQSCEPTHTVVHAYVNGDTVLADPVYNVVWPDDAGGYLDARDLSRNPDELADRLAELRHKRGPKDKINFYSSDEMQYAFPKTINWDASPILSLAGDAVGLFVDDKYLVFRPRFLEDPKLFLKLAALGAAAFFALLLALLRMREDRIAVRSQDRKARSYGPVPQRYVGSGSTS
jgi:hypothetical protein